MARMATHRKRYPLNQQPVTITTHVKAQDTTELTFQRAPDCKTEGPRPP